MAALTGSGSMGERRAQAVGFDDEGVFVEFQAVFQVALGRFEDVEGYVAGVLNLIVHFVHLFYMSSG